MSGLQTHTHHRTCQNCGHGLVYHDKKRVYPDDGPAGTYHYRYVGFPEGNGVFRR